MRLEAGGILKMNVGAMTVWCLWGSRRREVCGEFAGVGVGRDARGGAVGGGGGRRAWSGMSCMRGADGEFSAEGDKRGGGGRGSGWGDWKIIAAYRGRGCGGLIG